MTLYIVCCAERCPVSSGLFLPSVPLSASVYYSPLLASALQRYSFYLRFRLRFSDSVLAASPRENKDTQVRSFRFFVK